MHEEFCYHPEISCSHPCFKGNWLWRFESMDPNMLAIIYFYFYFWERDSFILTKSLFTNFFYHSNKAGIKLHEQSIGAFGRVHKVHFWNVTYASFACCANFIIWSISGPCLISSMNLRILPSKFEKFLARVCPKRYASKVYGSITPKFINQNFDTMSHFD